MSCRNERPRGSALRDNPTKWAHAQWAGRARAFPFDPGPHVSLLGNIEVAARCLARVLRALRASVLVRRSITIHPNRRGDHSICHDSMCIASSRT